MYLFLLNGPAPVDGHNLLNATEAKKAGENGLKEVCGGDAYGSFWSLNVWRKAYLMVSKGGEGCLGGEPRNSW